MTHIPMEDLDDKVDSKYRLVMISAKRSRQLNQGAQPLVQPKGHKPTYIALEEMAAGRIEYSTRPLEEVTKAGVPEEVVTPAWFREIAPEGVIAEEEVEVEVERELEGEAPAEAEEGVSEVSEEVEGEVVGLDQLEKGDEEEEEETVS
ncbi:MAG: DNA-directed RNA polymerase subunit omega [Candidatus Methylomirabilales bacterium]